jgi:hypothetical protein
MLAGERRRKGNFELTGNFVYEIARLEEVLLRYILAPHQRSVDQINLRHESLAELVVEKWGTGAPAKQIEAGDCRLASLQSSAKHIIQNGPNPDFTNNTDLRRCVQH